MERRDFLSAIPGLAIGGVGMSVDDLLAEQGPQTDWTAAGGGASLNSKQLRALMQKLDELDKWQKSHVGLDAWAAGPDYPHPSQKVRTLLFFEGNGRLDPSGIQFLTSGVTARGLHWLNEYSDDPVNVVPSFQIRGDIQDPTGDPYVYSFIEANATANDSATLSVDAADPAASALNRVIMTLTNSAVTATVTAYVDPLTTANRALEVTELPLYFVGKTSDFTVLADGMLWYRSDTDKFRARINGVTENLATESYVATATNKQPFAAKTGTYTTTNADGVISVDATSGSFTVTLVTAVGNSGLTQTFKKINAANVVTIDASSTQTIDGALTYALSARYSWLTIVSDGSNWLITGAG